MVTLKKDESVEFEGQKSLRFFPTVTLTQEQARVTRTVPYHLSKTSHILFIFFNRFSVMTRETVTSEQRQMAVSFSQINS